MEERIKVDVKINGKEYTVIATEPVEYIYKIASYVDRKMVDISGSNSRLSTAMTAVLTAINLADEVHKSKRDDAAQDIKIAKYTNEIASLTAQINGLGRELDLLKKENGNLAATIERYKTNANSGAANQSNTGHNNK